MNTYTSKDSLFSNINKKGGISLISKINQNSGGNFKLVDIVDIDWDGSTVYTYNDNGDTTKNIINDSAQFLSIFQNTINRVESNNFKESEEMCSGRLRETVMLSIMPASLKVLSGRRVPVIKIGLFSNS